MTVLGPICRAAPGWRKSTQTRDLVRAREFWDDSLKASRHGTKNRDWNIGLADDLRDPFFAREFLLASIDKGVPLQIALGKVIRAMGVKEYAGKVRMASPDVLRAISPRHNPTQETLNRLLKPFRLRLSLAPLDKHRHQPAA